MSSFQFVFNSGATVRDLDTYYGVRVTMWQGGGMPPVDNIHLNYALGDGAIFQRTIARPRTITLVCVAPHASVAAFHSIRKKINADINRDALNSSTFTLRYSGAGATTVDIPVRYAGGLELSEGDGLLNKPFQIHLLAVNPFWQGSTLQTVAMNTTTALSNATWILQATSGIWAGFNGANGPSESPNAIVTDGSGNVWVGTSAGVYVNSAGVWTKYVTNGAVQALAVGLSGDVYAGGAFTTINSVPANRVAKINAGTWAALSTGIASGIVYALAFTGGNLYAGGSFPDGLAQWNGTAWGRAGTPAVNLASGTVYALTVDSSGNLFVGGSFSSISLAAGGSGATATCGISISSCWFYANAITLTAGGTGYWIAPTVTGTGGTHSGGCITDAVFTATVDGSGHVNGIVVNNGGGYTTSPSATLTITPAAGTLTANNLFYLTATGEPHPITGLTGTIYALSASGTTVYFGGSLSGGYNNIGYWNGSLNFAGSGLNNQVNGLTYDGTTVYAVGLFTNTGYPYFAKYAAGAWSSGGITLPEGGSAINLSGTKTTIGTVSPGAAPVVAGVAGTTSIVNTSTRLAYPTITITASGATTLQSIVNTYTGAQLLFNYAMGVGEVITITTAPGARSIVSSSAGNILGQLLSGSNLSTFGVSPGTNNYTIQATDGTKITVSFAYYYTFWSVDDVAA